MGCDIYVSHAVSPWGRQGIPYEDWFRWFPVDLRDGIGKLTCGVCGARVAEYAARVHIDWHERTDA